MKHLAIFLISILLIFTAGCSGILATSSTLPADEPQITSTMDSPWLETALPATDIPTIPTAEPATDTPAIPTAEPASAQPSEQKPSTGSQYGEQFDLQLAQAVEARDFETLRTLMKDRFSIATWNTELREISSEEALQRLLETSLAPGSAPLVKFSTDVPALLGGADPLAVWGPIANPVRAMHLTGLGSNSAGEAVMVIAKDNATGELYWHGLLIPQGTKFQAVSQPSGDVVQTDVHYVRAKEDLNVRSGPGENYAVEGLMRSGEISQVSGKSVNGVWWRIPCASDASGYCWISAIPTLSEPVDAPQR